VERRKRKQLGMENIAARMTHASIQKYYVLVGWKERPIFVFLSDVRL